MSTTAPFVGGNLRIARLFHGYSLEDVADHIGTSRQLVHKLETEQVTPSDLIITQIAKLTGFAVSFFSTPAPSPITEEQCHFRKNFTTRAAVKHIALAKGEVFRRLVSGLTSRLVFPKNRIPHIDVRSLADIEVAADRCRREWNLGLGPIQSMVRLAENVGAVVTSFRDVSREVDAYSISASRPIIVVNANDSSACRQRFDVAHELGHLVMHVGTQTGDRKSEGEANRFAGAFLLPRSSFVKEFPRLRGQHLNWQGLSEMKVRWRVSKSALLYRARQLSLITEDQHRTGMIRLARGGESKVEREDDLIEVEIGAVFAKALDVLCESERVTLEQLASQLNVSGRILEHFLSAQAPDAQELPEKDDEPQLSAVIISFAERRTMKRA